MKVSSDSAAPSGRLAARDGTALALRDWTLPGARRAVLFVHGLGEHGGRYDALAAWFRQRGYAARCYDQRGHGLSGGARGGLNAPDDLLDDLAVVYRDYTAALSFPPLLLGHSMGGLVAARAVLDRRIAPPALALSSPALRSRESPALRRLAKLLAKLAPNLPLSNGLRLDQLSHDPAVPAAYRADGLCHRRVTPRLADFIFTAGAACIADAPDLAVPTLLLVTGRDGLVDPAGSRDFAAGAWAGKALTTRFFDTLYHELFNEAEPARGQVLKQLADWLERLD